MPLAHCSLLYYFILLLCLLHSSLFFTWEIRGFSLECLTYPFSLATSPLLVKKTLKKLALSSKEHFHYSSLFNLPSQPFYGIKLLSLFAFLLTLLPFLLILSMNFSRFVQPKKSTVSATNSFSNSFKLLFHQTVITNVFWLMLIFSFFMASYQVLYPFLLLEHYQIHPLTFGIITSIIGIVAVFGSILPFFTHSRHSLKLIKSALIIFGFTFLLLGSFLFLSSSITFTLISFIIIGSLLSFINSIIEPLSYAYVQRHAVQETIGALTTVYYTLLELMIPIGTLLASTLILYFTDYFVFILFGVFILTLILILNRKDKNNEK